MAQFLDFRDDGTCILYHTVPSRAGTAEFEHKERVHLDELEPLVLPGGRTVPDYLVVRCPVAGCGVTAVVPVTGNTEAQRLHAHQRYYRDRAEHGKRYPHLRAAKRAVIEALRARGVTPLISEDDEREEEV